MQKKQTNKRTKTKKKNPLEKELAAFYKIWKKALSPHEMWTTATAFIVTHSTPEENSTH